MCVFFLFTAGGALHVHVVQTDGEMYMKDT